VLDPFAGIGSTGYEALRLRRQFVGIELKESYFRSAAENCERALLQRQQMSMFDLAPVASGGEE
jgi:DNA modification methylase